MVPDPVMQSAGFPSQQLAVGAATNSSRHEPERLARVKSGEEARKVIDRYKMMAVGSWEQRREALGSGDS